MDEPQTSECPRSGITQASIDLVQIVTTLVEAGESGMSTNLDDLPGYVVDAVRIARHEKKAVEAAQDEAVRNA